MREEIYMINHTWGYTARVVNPTNFTINYELRQGFRSEKEARESQKNEQKEYENNIKKIKNLTNIKYTFTEYIDYWFDSIYTVKGKTSTRVVTLYAINHLIKPNIKSDMLLLYITNDYINEIIEKCVRVSKESGRTCRKILRNLLKDAKLYGYLKTDIELMTIPESGNKMQLLNHKQLHQLLTVAKDHQAFYFEILLALFCGLRQGEILALKYSDFDTENKTISITNQYTREYAISKVDNTYQMQSNMVTRAPKSGSERKLKVPDFIFEELERKKQYNASLLKKAKERGQKHLPYSYIAVSVFGKRKTSSSLTPSLKRLCQKAGVPVITMHTLRHMFATIMIEQGIPLEHISKCMGHSSVLTTFNTYAGIMDADNQAKDFLDTLYPSSMNQCREERVVNV